MHLNLPRRFFLKSAAALVALALPIALLSQSAGRLAVSPAAAAKADKKTHTITISFANGAWSYTIVPAQTDPKKARIKRGETVNWISSNGSWSVFFKNGTTPLEDANGNPVSTVSGASGAANGALVAVKHANHTAFTYGVRLQPNGGGAPVVDDPEIIIEPD